MKSLSQRFRPLPCLVALGVGCAHDPAKRAPERTMPPRVSAASGGAADHPASPVQGPRGSGGAGSAEEEALLDQELAPVDAWAGRYVCGVIWHGPRGIAEWGWHDVAVDVPFSSLRVTESGERTEIVFSFWGAGHPFGTISWTGEGKLDVTFSGLSNLSALLAAAKVTKPAGLVTTVRPGEHRLEESEGHAPPWAAVEFDVDWERCTSIDVEFSAQGVSPKRLTIVLGRIEQP